ncbi:MAG: nucleoside triphosphate pyrophosphohydrolase [Halioglobus sp.]|nr:nucleoside triphosphate pyrophosphohydrolase [Halioglobus sp.]
MDRARYTVADLLRVMQRLRDPESGCPWDLQQDFRSIVPSTLEECYELAHAIEQDDHAHIAEELGDVLFQVVFYAQLGSEQGLFAFEDVVDTLAAKLIRRHPHVFADGELEGVVGEAVAIEEVGASWEAIKRQERAEKSQTGLLADVPVALPALPRAQKLQKRAAQVGFDWPGLEPVLHKIDEELAELQEAVAAADDARVMEELGDVLFSCVNLSRHLACDAEASLRAASGKFETRFRTMEALAGARGQTLGELGDDALDELWREAKAQSAQDL